MVFYEAAANMMLKYVTITFTANPQFSTERAMLGFLIYSFSPQQIGDYLVYLGTVVKEYLRISPMPVASAEESLKSAVLVTK